MPVTTKIPPPMIAPTLMATALHKPIERFSFMGSFSNLITVKSEIQQLPIKACKPSSDYLSQNSLVRKY
jgi:hypothetical protein